VNPFGSVARTRLRAIRPIARTVHAAATAAMLLLAAAFGAEPPRRINVVYLPSTAVLYKMECGRRKRVRDSYS